MKKFFSVAGLAAANYRLFRMPLASIFVLLLSTGFLLSCNKESIPPDEGGKESAITELRSTANLTSAYPGLGWNTFMQLQQAKAASAKYNDFKKAMADGYDDIEVVIENMGYHYLNPDLLDGVFDPTKPEILVYKKMDNGQMRLVAVEYAVPIDMSEAAPEGFAGSADVWTRAQGFGLWLLHAWVWEYNPDGVFNPTNSRVHVH